MNYLCPVCHRSIAVAVGAAELRCTGCTLVAPLSRVGTAPGVAVPVALDRAGTSVAGYQLADRIGAGGMGTVYRATAPDGATVAIKLLHPEASRVELLERFRREGEALRRLVHPRVVRLIDLGDDAGTPYLVTELVDGSDLAAVLATRRPSVAEAAAIMIQVCEGVAAAHAVGIVHRDLKPANVLVAGDGSAKVVDFGLAQLAGDPMLASLTRTDVAMGTMNYLAPEQRRSAKTVDGRADVFALGVMFYELITGEVPLGRFPLPSARGLPRTCDPIVERSLAPDPDQRYPTVDALAADLRGLIATAPRRSWRGIAAAVAGLAGVSGIVLAAAFAGGGGPPPSSSSSAGTGSAAVDAGGALSSQAAPPVVVDAAVPDAVVVVTPTTTPEDDDEIDAKGTTTKDLSVTSGNGNGKGKGKGKGKVIDRGRSPGKRTVPTKPSKKPTP
jgi:hypothetical protein